MSAATSTARIFRINSVQRGSQISSIAPAVTSHSNRICSAMRQFGSFVPLTSRLTLAFDRGTPRRSRAEPSSQRKVACFFVMMILTSAPT